MLRLLPRIGALPPILDELEEPLPDGMKIFISYSHSDATVRERLETHLAMLRRQGLVEVWFDQEILAGGEIDEEISSHLEECGIFIALVSPDFLASEYCYDREMARALERMELGHMRIIPIIIEPCDWMHPPLVQLKAVPKDGLPISEWENENRAYLDVVEELRRVIGLEMQPAKNTSNKESAVASVQKSRTRLLVERDFSQEDKVAYRYQAFEAFQRHMEASVKELNGLEGIYAEFIPLSPTSFGARITNSSKKKSTTNITVHRGDGSFSLGDIFYAFQENSPANMCNGSFSVQNDEYRMFLESWMSFDSEKEQLDPEDAATLVFQEMMKQVGIRYD